VTAGVIALGGNALTRPGERGTAAEQLANLRRTCAALAPLLVDGEIVLTHGNGPQVGNELLRHERAAEEAPPLPLYLAVAQTQAEIGALLATELRGVTDRPVACILTHVGVSRDDPAFGEPTKPVGPFYSEEEARRRERERGWFVVHEAGRGWRRAVPSPTPLEVVELDAVRTLLAAGTVAIACGGGGIPVVRENGRIAGIDAVIDKDRASALLAARLQARRLLVLTDVPGLYRDFGSSSEHEVRELSPDEAEALLPELPEGSMRPKLEACLAFVRATGGEAIIASADTLEAALAGDAGTRIRPSDRE
jgi:carbamate kinase